MQNNQCMVGSGDREAAKAAYQVTESKTAGVGQKMDLAFSMLRCATLASSVPRNLSVRMMNIKQ